MSRCSFRSLGIARTVSSADLARGRCRRSGPPVRQNGRWGLNRRIQKQRDRRAGALRTEQLEQRRLLAIDVTNVTSSAVDGLYNVGDTIDVSVTFSGPVGKVTGIPQLRLASGSNAFAQFNPTATGSFPTSTLKFTYQIQAGENAADLDYVTVNSLELGSGGVLDQFGVPAQLTLPVPGGAKSLGWNKNLVVDTTNPSASLTLSKTAVGNENNSATLTITLSESSTDFTLDDVVVTHLGVPLDNAEIFRNFIGSGKTYSVVFTPPAAFVGTVLFDIPASSFTDAAGNFNVVLPGSGAQLEVDTNAPVVRSVTSSADNGVFNTVGDTIDIQVEFSTNVVVGSLGPQGFPFLELNSGAGARAEWVSAMGSVVTFRYTVADGEEARDLDYRSIDALKGGYILRLDTGTQALRTLPEPGGSGSLAANKNLVVDTRGPSLAITSSRHVLGANQTAKITFTLSEPADPLSSFSLADVQINNPAAGTLVAATWMYDSATRSYSVDFVPTGGATGFTGQVSFSVNPGAFQDAAGNDNSFASLTPPISVNTAPPGTPTVTLLVTKDGSPLIQGTTGSAGLQANQRLIVEVGGGTYDSRSGSSGVRVSGNTWSLNLATAVPVLGTSWTAPTGPAVDIYEVVVTIVDDSSNEKQDGSANELTIDTVVPRVLGVASTTANGVYGVGQQIAISVTFSEPVTVAGGIPTLLLNAGNGARAIYTSGTGTNVLVFTYTVGSGEAAADLDYLNTSALQLNGSTIRDAAKNDAVIALVTPGSAGSLGSAAQIEIETVAPTTTMTSNMPTLKKGETAVITVTFSEPPLTVPLVTVLPLGAGNVLSLAGTSNPNVWTAIFTPNLNFEGMANFSLGAYTDRAGNPGSTTSLATPIQIDTKSPTVVVSVSPLAGTTLNSTGSVTATFTWSEPVTFSAAKVALTNLSLVAGSWSQAGNVYTASYIPAANTSGTGSIAVPLAAATDSLGNPSDALAPVSFSIDTIAPTAGPVTSPDANGTYGVGKTITIQVTFPEAVTVTGGIPYLVLNTGNGSQANYTGGTGTSILTFKYIVAAGENSSDLDYASTSALQLPSGTTIRDAAGNNAVLTLVPPGTAGSLGSGKAIVIETAQPTATVAVNKSVVKKGETATITVTFVKPPVASTLKALTVTPSNAGTVSSLTATGPNVYTAVFTPSANFEGTALINLPGDYEDIGGNKGLPASSTSITVDTKSSTVTVTTSPAATTTLIAGSTVTATFVWNEAVTFSADKVTLGNLTLVPGSWQQVDPQGTTYRASYAPPTNFTGSGSIAVLLGAATDTVGNLSDASGASNFPIDTIVPTIPSVRQAPTTPNGTYGLAKDISIEVVFTEPVTVNGVPSLYLNAGNGARANYFSGSGTNILTFKYTVGVGEVSSDLDYTSTSALWLNGGSIRDASGNNAVLTLPAPGSTGSLGSNAQIVIETTAPTATMTSSSYRLKKGEKATITVTFSERPLLVPTLTVTPANGAPTTTLSLTQVGSNSSVYAAEFTPAANYSGGVNMTLPGTYTDPAGNIGSSATLPQLIQVDTASPACQVTADIAAGTTLTRTSSVRVTFTWSEPVPFPSSNVPIQNLDLVSWTDVGGLNTTYVAIYTPKQDFEGSGSLTVPAGAVVDSFGNPSETPVSLSWPIDTLSPGVVITATPISIASGGLSEVAIKFSSVPTGFTVDDLIVTTAGSAQGSFNGTFGPTSDPTIWKGTYSAVGGDGAATFKVLAGAFTDAKGNPNVAGDELTILVDTIAPQVLSVAAAAGAYKAGDVIVIKVVFTEALPNLAGEPVLGIPLTTGGIAEWFATDSADVSGKTQLFRYVVADGDNAKPLDYLDGSITGGPVTDAVGNEADLLLPVPGGPGSLATSQVIIDTAAPTIVNVLANKSNVVLKAEGLVRIDVVFSEPLPYTASTLPAMTLELNSGGTATSKTMINDRTVRFWYVVKSGENASSLDFESGAALAVSGALLDEAGNSADLTLPMPGGPGSLSPFKIVIDTVAPTVDDVTVVTPPGAYNAGDVLTFKVTFAEKILVAGTPTLKLALAGNRYATFDRIEGDTSAIFTYTVQAGDSTEKLDYDGPAALSGVITDVAGNAAILSLPTPGFRGSISDNHVIVIDTTAPAVKANGVSPLSGPGTYGMNSVIRFTVEMTEPVTTSGQVRVLLNTTPARYADLVSSDGTTLIFEYRPRIGDRAINLNHASTMALTGMIVDRAGNAANLTLPAPIPPGSFGGAGVIAVDAKIGVLSTSPALSLTPHGPIFRVPLRTIDIVLTTPVTGVSLAGIKLYFQDRSVSLTGATITGSGANYRLTLPRSATSLNGRYRLRIGGVESGIRADSGDGGTVPMMPVNLYWQKAK